MAKAISRISDLIIKHLKGELTMEEYQELQDWVHLSEENSILFAQLTDADSLAELLQESDRLRRTIKNKIDQRIGDYDRVDDNEHADLQYNDSWHSERLYVGAEEGKLVYLPGVRRSRRRVWLYAAAACFLAILTGGYFWMTNRPSPSIAGRTVPVSKNDVAPGSDKAILTLGNGSTIVLENAGNGNLAVEGNSRVTKDKNLLAYTVNGNTPTVNNSLATPTPPAIVYNTLTTPRAGQYRLVLPDGSKVWLNNSSSLKYPTSFTGKNREVMLSGEAYFEVAKDAAKPFIVKLTDIVVNVLGTSFNIMAYGDDPAVKTTLLTGKVSVAATGNMPATADNDNKTSQAISKSSQAQATGRQTILSPGEQAIVSQEGNWKILKGVDTEEAIAWQRGYFHFSHENIGDVLRQLARWYDVEVEITIPVPDYTYDGEIGRDLSLSAILRHLEKKDLHFQIDGKKLIVSR